MRASSDASTYSTPSSPAFRGSLIPRPGIERMPSQVLTDEIGDRADVRQFALATVRRGGRAWDRREASESGVGPVPLPPVENDVVVNRAQHVADPGQVRQGGRGVTGYIRSPRLHL